MRNDIFLGLVTGMAVGVALFCVGFIFGGGSAFHDAVVAGLIEQYGQIYRVVPAEVK